MEITTNQLSLTGVIMENPQFDHEVFGEAFFRTVLSVPRLSGAFDLLPLTISERLMGEDFQQGATVAIGGQLRSYNKVMGGAGRLLLTAFAQHLRPVDEEENPNTVFLSGALCKPPVYRRTPLGREICDVMLAVPRPYRRTDYIPCILWGKNAQEAADALPGAKLRVTGRLQSRDYVKVVDGVSQTRTAYELSVTQAEFPDAPGFLEETAAFF